MCCFSGSVDSVTATKIFARFLDDNRQALVYQMNYKAKEPVAMILPIPVPENTPDDAVKFINLEKYKNFFKDMQKGFPIPKPGRGKGAFGGGTPKAADLVVHDVGSFVASFVPTLADFSRLDAQFRLPEKTWDSLPAYKAFGFAVFQLKPDKTSVHPMAFTFPHAKGAKLFFPTVHIHDGAVHKTAQFDHELYLQPQNDSQMLPGGWQESTQPAGLFMKVKETAGIVSGDLHCYRMTLKGKLANADVFVA